MSWMVRRGVACIALLAVLAFVPALASPAETFGCCVVEASHQVALPATTAAKPAVRPFVELAHKAAVSLNPNSVAASDLEPTTSPSADHARGLAPKSGLTRGAQLRAQYGEISAAELHQRINLRGVIESVENNALAAAEAAQGVSPSFGRLGTRAHTTFERLNLLTNQRIKGTGFRIATEEFRLASPGYGIRGPLAGRRAAGSLGLDAVLYDRAIPVVGFDLKTGGASWSAARLAELNRRFGVPLVRIRVP